MKNNIVVSLKTEEKLQVTFNNSEIFGDSKENEKKLIQKETQLRFLDDGLNVIEPLNFEEPIEIQDTEGDQSTPTLENSTPSDEVFKHSSETKGNKTILNVAMYATKSAYSEKRKIKSWKQTLSRSCESEDAEVARLADYLRTLCLDEHHFVIVNVALTSNNSSSNICVIETCRGKTYVIEPELPKSLTERNYVNYLTRDLCYDLMIQKENMQRNNEKSFNTSTKNADFKRRCCRHHFKYYFKYFPVFRSYGKIFLESVERKLFLSFTLDVGFFLSILALICVFVSTLMSKRWRKEKGNMILFHFSLPIFAQIIIHFSICLFDLDIFQAKLASITFQYFTIVEFSWTSIIAYMQYKRYVKILNGARISSISTLVAFAYLSSAIPTLLRIILEKNYSVITITYLTFSIPQAVFLFINLVILILILRNIVCMRVETVDKKSNFSTEFKLIVILFFIFDLGWILAMFAYLTSNIAFAYIFIFSQSIQGFILFFIFVVLNKRNQKIYKRKFGLCSVQNVITTA
ncbi:hypothetical protein WA026_017494 [Henosepilachna vigintioctopunctata]|uniref:G-protein coupled receptors family 2 profile 2 domain-containing protein n=1 Tax=Henosepilachna vigintioctopunctata TaxID=420089 RepID=A0AAW1V1E2_9CUCU